MPLSSSWGATLTLALDFAAVPSVVPATRQVVERICQQQLGDAEEASLLVIATQELLENLVKYSTAPALFKFELAEQQGETQARFHTQNHGSLLHVERCHTLLTSLLEAPDSTKVYESLVASSSDRPGSGLGLARLVAEAGMTLDFKVAGPVIELSFSRKVTPAGYRS